VVQAKNESKLKIKETEQFKNILLLWFEGNARSFPWRISDNKFHLLVAEVLLRKTQANTVLSTYNWFCDHYRKPEDVLNADSVCLEGELGKLGLKQRIQWLRNICDTLVHEFDGEIPDSYDKLLHLKGIGQYTAKMVLCIGYGKDCIPIDNNIARLISRVFNVKRMGDTRREYQIETIINKMEEFKDSRNLTLAMLDLAGLICRETNPKCLHCPLINLCKYKINQDHNNG
jgi:A/G-specific DNA glycosylase